MTARKFGKKPVIKIGLIVLFFGFSAVMIFSGHSKGISASAKNIPESDMQKSGASIYREHCISCHGADGRSKTARGKRKGASDLTKSRISFSKGVRIILNGKGRMPKFKNDLSNAEARRVNSYVRGFRK